VFSYIVVPWILIVAPELPILIVVALVAPIVRVPAVLRSMPPSRFVRLLNVFDPEKVCDAVLTPPGWVASAGCRVRICPDNDAPLALGEESNAASVTSPVLLPDRLVADNAPEDEMKAFPFQVNESEEFLARTISAELA